MKSQVLLTVWCNISGGAGGEIWHWSLSGVKGLTGYVDRSRWKNLIGIFRPDKVRWSRGSVPRSLFPEFRNIKILIWDCVFPLLQQSVEKKKDGNVSLVPSHKKLNPNKRVTEDLNCAELVNVGTGSGFAKSRAEDHYEAIGGDEVHQYRSSLRKHLCARSREDWQFKGETCSKGFTEKADPNLHVRAVDTEERLCISGTRG